MPGPDDLEAGRQPVCRQARRNRRSRMTGKVEGIGEGHSPQQGDGLPVNLAAGGGPPRRQMPRWAWWG